MSPGGLRQAKLRLLAAPPLGCFQCGLQRQWLVGEECRACVSSWQPFPPAAPHRFVPIPCSCPHPLTLCQGLVTGRRRQELVPNVFAAAQS